MSMAMQGPFSPSRYETLPEAADEPAECAAKEDVFAAAAAAAA